MKGTGATITPDSLREILKKDDVDSLKEFLEGGLDSKLWLDADPYESLLAIAILQSSANCVGLLLDRGGDWAIDAPFDEDLDPPFSCDRARHR